MSGPLKSNKKIIFLAFVMLKNSKDKLINFR